MNSTLRFVAAALFAAAAVVAALSARGQDVLGDTGVRGAGSTFAYPALSKWSREYRAARARGSDFPIPNGGLDDPPAGSALEYEPVGSLAGTLRVKDGGVDFGATDMPLASGELTQLRLGQFPLLIGGIVVAVNVDGVSSGQLKLTGPVLAGIFLGRISRWSDPAIATLNAGLALPDAPIAVIHRSDGSGTTFNFTDYLSKVSAEWKVKAGAALLVHWPTGSGSKGNEGVANAVRTVRNSIGYVEYAQASRMGLAYAQIQNRAGRFVRPGPAGFRAAARNADWDEAQHFHLLLTDGAGEDAYPITASVFVLMRRSASRSRTRAALDFFRWSLEHGANTAASLGYVPLREPLVQRIKAYWSRTFNVVT
jgi:phosphate transport system substrate-binding protein